MPWPARGNRRWLTAEQRVTGDKQRPTIPPARGAGLRVARTLRALPRQIVPPTEAVELTPAERAAFAGLVRQFSEGRH